jgi:hypothetical protein
MLSLFLSYTSAGQSSDSLQQKSNKSPFKISTGIDVYYGYDFSEPAEKNRQYTTQASKHNEFNLNWGFLQADYSTDHVRASLALQTGTYVQANYAAESNALTQLIAQANVGVRLTKRSWLDLGILPSHIGYESTFSLNNEIYTRALMAENSPYYEAGVQLTTSLSDKLITKFLVLNGWQNIHETNHAKSLGFGISYIPSSTLTFGYSNYYGNEAPDSLKAKRRFFHSLFTKYAFTTRLTMACSVDYGRQELLDSNKMGVWYAGMMITKYQLSPLMAIAARIEHYNDEEQLIVLTNTPNGFQTSSASLDFDYIPVPDFLWRLEVRGYESKDNVFLKKGGSQRNNLLIVTSMAIKL